MLNGGGQMTQSDSSSIDDRLFDAARSGDVSGISALLEQHPEKLGARDQPYEHTLLHTAAFAGHLPVVDLLLDRGIDADVREKGDNTYPMHWAAAAGHKDIVRRLADAGGDVVGHGDDHELEVIGWATCWDGIDQRHREIADFLVSRGAHHHIFSAMSLGLADEVRRIVASNPAALSQPMSRNENFQRPLHFAVRMKHPEMITLLLELGADPAGTDDSGNTASVYANTPEADKPLLHWNVKTGTPMGLFTAVALHDWKAADQVVASEPAAGDNTSLDAGALHLMSKRKDLEAVKWLLSHGSNPNSLWSHFGAMVAPLHMAVWQDSAEIVQALLAAGADPGIHDSMHDSDAAGWARYGGRTHLVEILENATG